MGGLFGKSQSKQTPAYTNIDLQTSAYGSVVPVVYGTQRVAPNLIWYGDFVANAHRQSSGGKGGVGGGGGKGGNGSVTYTYATAVAMAVCEGPIASIGNVYVDKNVTSLANAGLSLFTGSYSQNPWSYLTSKHPGEALNYHGVAYVAAQSMQLGSSPHLPNHNLEVYGTFSSSIAGQKDADPSQVITDMLTNTHYGMNFPAARVGNFSVYQAYAIATGLWVSPAYTDAAAGNTILDELAQATNSEFVWSSGVLKLVPYGDQNVTANGYTYTAPSAPVYSLGLDDFLCDAGDDPVQLQRQRPADAVNHVQLEYLDRSNSYNTGMVEVKDQNAIDLYGIISAGSITAHMFADSAAALISAQLQLQRQQVRNTYKFRTDLRFMAVDPMDILAITEPGLGLSNTWVRVKEIALNDDDTLEFTVEEYLQGTGTPGALSAQAASGWVVNYNSDPGAVNDPIIFDASVQIALTGLETWIAVSGGTNWGGADVYVSSDDVQYKYAGRVNGNARMGVLTAALPVGTDPDTVNTMAVNLNMSAGTLQSGTQEDADLYNTLCYVDGELVSFQTATLTGLGLYSCTYLRRGGYGTAIAAHAIGAKFARLDDAIFKYPYDKTQIGTTVYVKFCSFNVYGGGLQAISDVSAFPHVMSGPPIPPDVTGFQGQQNGNVVAFAWNKVRDFALRGYNVGYAPMGTTDWAQFTILSEVAAGTEMTNASVPPGSWTFGIRAQDIADQLSANMATFDLVVVNENNVVVDAPQETAWLGTVNGFVRHWTGVIVPMSQNNVAADGWNTFDKYVPNPVSSAFYITPVLDNGFNDQVRVWSSTMAQPGMGQAGTPEISTSLDSWLDGESDPNAYQPWVIGYRTLRYAKMRVDYTGISEGTVSYLSSFNVQFDRGEDVVTKDNVVIAAGGTIVVFDPPFHLPPFVSANYTGATPGAYATASEVTATQCEINVWSPAGASIGGTVTYQATGV